MIIGLVDYRIRYLASFQLSESVFRSVYCPNATWWFIMNTPTDILQITFIHTAHRHLYVAGDTYLYRRLSCPWWQLRGAACSSSCLERWGRPPDTAARTPPENDTQIILSIKPPSCPHSWKRCPGTHLLQVFFPQCEIQAPTPSPHCCHPLHFWFKCSNHTLK